MMIRRTNTLKQYSERKLMLWAKNTYWGKQDEELDRQELSTAKASEGDSEIFEGGDRFRLRDVLGDSA